MIPFYFLHHLGFCFPSALRCSFLFLQLYKLSLIVPPSLLLPSVAPPSHRPRSDGPLAAPEAEVKQGGGSVPFGGGHLEVRRQTGGHRGAGEDQTPGEKQQGKRGTRGAAEGGQILPAPPTLVSLNALGGLR